MQIVCYDFGLALDLILNKILINGRFLSRRPTGVDRFAIEVVRALDHAVEARDPSVDGLHFEVVVPRGDVLQRFVNIPVRQFGRLRGQAWEQIELAMLGRNGFLVNLCNTAPFFVRQQATVIHDVATEKVPASYGRLFRTWYSLLTPALYRRSKCICTVSQFSKSELASIYGVRDGVAVLPEGTDHMGRLAADATVLARNGLRARPYVLAVSSLSPHKNFAAVVRAVELLGDVDFDVVVAGGQNPRVFAGAGGGLSSSVKYVGYVTDEELKALYENAACFVFPSIYEGYGLPPTEAMACGCPVLAAGAASIPEVCGEAAIYFDPHDPSSLAAALARVMTEPLLREDLRKRGLARAGALIWRDAALELLSVIRRATA